MYPNEALDAAASAFPAVQVYEACKDGIMIVSLATGRLVCANSSACRCVGYSSQEIQHVRWEALLDRGDAGTKHCVRELKTAGRFHGSLRFLRPGGESYPVSAFVMAYGSGGAKQAIVIFRDVSEQIRAEESLRTRNRLLAMLSQAAVRLLDFPFATVEHRVIAELLLQLTDALFVFVSSFDPETQQLVTEALATRVRPSVVDKALGLLGSSLIGRQWPIDMESFRQHQTGRLTSLPGVYELAFGRIPRPVCTQLERLLGAGEVYGVGLVRQGQVMGNLAVIMPKGRHLQEPDIVEIFAGQVAATHIRCKVEQELRESREQYRSLFEHSRDAAFVVSPNGHYLEVNPAACDMLGYSRAELLNRCIAMPSSQKDLDRTSFGRLLVSGSFLGEEQMTAKDGRVIPVEISASRLPDGTYLGLVRDTTERKRAEEAQLEREAAMERERVRTHFLQLAAHELRNPMTGIKGLLGLMHRRADSGKPLDQVIQAVPVMEREIDRLSGLLNEILDAFRAQEGRLVLKRDRVNLIEAIRVALVPFEMVREKYRFSFEAVGDVELWVTGDFDRLGEVFHNLFNNAVKYMPGGGDIDVTLAVHGPWVRVSVADQGVGIPKDQMEHIFEEFFRASNIQRGADPGGLGLGLYICRDIVQNHGGRIWVESSEGRGSTFFVELPLAEERRM